MEVEPFEVVGRVVEVLISAQPGILIEEKIPVFSETYGHGLLVTSPVPKIHAIEGQGIRGDRHAGVRLSDVRERAMNQFGIPKGTQIANLRQFSMTSVEELDEIRHALNLSLKIPQGYLGENLIIEGIPRLSKLPPGTLLFFKKKERPRSTVLYVAGENTPCKGPGEALQYWFENVPNLDRHFPQAALHKRGIVGLVYCSGIIEGGDTIIAKLPAQHLYTLA